MRKRISKMLSYVRPVKTNKGLTLVELIVTIALMVIVGGAITSFVVVAQRNYNYGVADADLQYEAQLLSNRMQDLMIDTAKGISYEYTGELASGDPSEGLILDDSLIGSDVSAIITKQLYVYDSDKYYKLEWNMDTHEILYSEYKPDNTETLTAGPELLAEYVTAFSVDLRELASKRTVKYTITFTKEGSGKEYTTTHKIKLRNEALVNTAVDAIYTPGPIEITATGITVYIEKEKMWPTETSQVMATVTSDSGLMPSQTVTWSVEGNTDPNTAITANLLSYGVNETGSTVGSGTNYVTVKAVQGSLQATGEIGVRRINDITSTVYTTKNGTKSGITDNKLQEGDKQITVEVAAFSGVHISDLLLPMDSDEGNRKKTIENMGGVTMSYTGGEFLQEAPSWNAETGRLSFSVKDDIDFSVNPEPKIVNITISCTRPGFSGISTTQTFTITERKIQPITVEEWDRQGKIKLDLSQIPEEQRELMEGTDRGNVGVYIEFYRKDNTRINSFELSNSGGFPGGNPYDSKEGKYYMDTNGYVRLLYTPNNYLDAELQLLPRFSYSNEPYNTYNYWNDAVDYVMLTVKYGRDLQYSCEPVKITINPVSFLYNTSPYGDQDTWTNEYVAYFSPGNKRNYYGYKYQTIKVYYMLDEGWADSNTEYQVKNDRFICSINGQNVSDYVAVKSGSDKYGHYVTFSIYNWYIEQFKNNTMEIVYEGQDINPTKGCKGVIKLNLVGDDKNNIVLYYWKDGWNWLSEPGTLYCPPEIIEDAKKSSKTYYYYINDEERFEYREILDKDGVTNQCITYQKLVAKWVNSGHKKGHYEYYWEYKWIDGYNNEQIVWLSYQDNLWQYEGVLTNKK